MLIEICSATATLITQLITDIPEFNPMSQEKIQNRIDENHVILFLAKKDAEIQGFIVAYEKSTEHFYNWLTGVKPEFRGKSVGTRLLNAFEAYASVKGYKICSIKSMEKFHIMLHLLKNRHYLSVSNQGEKIHFEKRLGKCDSVN